MSSVAGEQERAVVDAVAAELRIVVTEARTLTALMALRLPELDRLLARSEVTRANLPQQLAEAIDNLPDPVYKAAAADLFPLPYAETGWLKLAARGRAAGSRFDISYDGFRRATEGRRSRMDDVIRQVAGALVDAQRLNPGVREPGQSALTIGGGEAPEPTSAASQAIPGRSRRLFGLGVIGVIVILVLVAVGLTASRDHTHEGQPAAGFLPNGCTEAVGKLGPDLTKEPDAAQLSARLVRSYRQAAAGENVGCPTGVAYRWQAIAVQELSKNGRGNGALIASPNGVDLYLNTAAWGSYHQIGGKTGDSAQTTAGLPVRAVPYSDGHVEIEFSAGVVMVAERIDAPYFWIPSTFVILWRGNQSTLGLPTSNPLPTLRQDFQHGYVTVDSTERDIPTITLLTNPQSELPALEAIRGHILREADATTWYVSPDGKREWIPDGQTWTCLGGDDVRVAADLPGYAIATLPFGGEAACP